MPQALQGVDVIFDQPIRRDDPRFGVYMSTRRGVTKDISADFPAVRGWMGMRRARVRE